MKDSRLTVVAGLCLAATACALLTGCTDRKADAESAIVSGSFEVAETDLASGVGGRIKSVAVEEGDTVAKGQVIAKLDDAELAALVAQAKGALATAQANLSQANSQPAAVAAPGVAALRPNTRHLKDAAQGQVDQAEGALALAQARLNQATITAPSNGVVTRRFRSAGEFAAPGAPLVRISNLDTVWLRVYAHLPTLGRVKIGQKVRITTDAYPGKDYAGRVVSISDEPEFTPKNVQTAAERVKLVYAIRIKVENRSRELKPGIPGEAHLELSRRR